MTPDDIKNAAKSLTQDGNIYADFLKGDKNWHSYCISENIIYFMKNYFIYLTNS